MSQRHEIGWHALRSRAYRFARTARGARCAWHPRRGAMLLEVMLSVVLFVGAASFCLAATRSLFGTLERIDRRQRAIDLARSKLAELEAGQVTLGELRGEWSGAVGSRLEDEDLEIEPRGPVWEIDVETSQSEFRGLTLVELTVSEITEEAGPDDAPGGVRFTLRQLMALRETDTEAYEADELLEGLPEVGP
ncbi:MAG: type IV pilus modification PilV family protein [Planctomycetota bacterium]